MRRDTQSIGSALGLITAWIPLCLLVILYLGACGQTTSNAGNQADLTSAERSYLNSTAAAMSKLSDSAKSLDNLVKKPDLYNAKWQDKVFGIIQKDSDIESGCLGILTPPPRFKAFHSLCAAASIKVDQTETELAQSIAGFDEQRVSDSNAKMQTAVQELSTLRQHWRDSFQADLPTNEPTEAGQQSTTSHSVVPSPPPPTSTPAIGQSAARPYPRGQVGVVSLGWEVTVMDYNPDAWSVVRGISPTNVQPDPGYHVLLVRLRLKNVGYSLKYPPVPELVGANNIRYQVNHPLCVAEPGLFPTATLGQSTDWATCFHVRDGEGPLLLTFDFGVGQPRQYFALQ
jgi:hypothetical protein